VQASVYWIRQTSHTDMFSQGYIGVSKDTKKRWNDHSKYTGNNHLLHAIKKYGWDNLVKEVILVADKAYCLMVEAKLRAEDKIGWNIAKGGGMPPHINVWNKGLTIDDERVKNNIEKIMSNPNRGKNISKKLKDVPKSKEHKENIQKAAILRWKNEDEREKQSYRLISHLIKNNYRNPKTKLENKFQTIFESLGFLENVDFIYQKQISSAIFDFYFENKNLLIEVDGDFHHCNPNSKHAIPKYAIQLKTISNDVRKNRIADNKKIKLFRFWELDINNNIEQVIEILKKEL
jgi:very-short-patch-repair endonuclease